METLALSVKIHFLVGFCGMVIHSVKPIGRKATKKEGALGFNISFFANHAEEGQ